jgi:hypothetical protein
MEYYHKADPASTRLNKFEDQWGRLEFRHVRDEVGRFSVKRSDPNSLLCLRQRRNTWSTIAHVIALGE